MRASAPPHAATTKAPGENIGIIEATMLEKDITRLAKAIRDAVTKYKAQSTVPTRRYVHVRRRDFSLKYHEDFGFGQFAPQRVVEDVWDWNDQQQFGVSVIKSLEEYRSLVSTLGPNPSLMESLVRALSFASFRGLDDRELGEHASALALELAGTPLPVTVTAFIDGLTESVAALRRCVTKSSAISISG